MGRLRKILVIKALELALAGSARGDRWTYFYPAEVKKVTCSVSAIVDARDGVEYWQAEAHAERPKELGDWAMTVGRRPFTLRGRHKAEHDCSKWMDVAHEKMKKAH